MGKSNQIDNGLIIHIKSNKYSIQLCIKSFLYILPKPKKGPSPESL